MSLDYPNHHTPRFHVTCVGFNTLPYEEYMSVYVAELEALGGIVTKENNCLRGDAINFVFASYYLLDVFKHHHANLDWYSPFLKQLMKTPRNIIFCNLEQVTPGSAIFGSGHLDLLRQSFIFDYSNYNVNGFKKFGFDNVKLVHPLYSPSLDRKTHQEETTDILFTGAITPHRKTIIDQIEEVTGKKVSTFHYSLWGEQLQNEILKSKIILNIKGQPNNRSFEALRCLFPLSNNKTIISQITDETEIHPAFKNSIITGTADELPMLCKQVLDNEGDFKKITEQHFEEFKKISFSQALQDGLDAFYTYRNERVAPPWHVQPPTKIVFGEQFDGLWNYESLHIDGVVRNGVDLIWNPNDAFPLNQSLKTIRFGHLTIQPETIHSIEVNLFLARCKDLTQCMKVFLDLLVPGGEISFFLPCDNEAWNLPYAVRSFNHQSFAPFLGLEVKKMGWKQYTFEQAQISYVPTSYGTKRLDELQNDIPKWIENPGTVKYLSIKLIKKALSSDYHPYDLDFMAQYVD